MVPAYNEERRLPGTLDRIVAFLRAESFPSEIIVVDDGSRDRTVELVRQRMDQTPPHVELRLISYAPNAGKGAAVRRGCLAARGKYVLYTDADLPTPIEEVRKLLSYLTMGYDLAIGNRIQPDGSDMRESQPLHRRVLGKIYHGAVAALAVQGIADTQCGFKALTREAAQALCSTQRLTGWVFDTEILYLAQRWHYRIAQVPIAWSNVGGSRMELTARQAIAVLRDLVSIRWTHRNAPPPHPSTREDTTR